MVGAITKGWLSLSKAFLCEICCLGVMANSVLCVRCGKSIHSRYAKMIRKTSMFLIDCSCNKHEGNIV